MNIDKRQKQRNTYLQNEIKSISNILIEEFKKSYNVVEEIKRKIFCYIRISTDKQDYIRQKNILEERGYFNGKNCTYLCETYTGKTNNRPIFDDLLKNKINEGDTIVVESLTRLSRGGIAKTLDLISDLILKKKVNVYIIKEGFNLKAGEELDASTSFILGIFALIAKFERDIISERTKDSLRAKKVHGTKTGNAIGHPRTNKANQLNFIKTLEMIINNNVGQTKASIKTGFPKYTFNRDIKKCYEKSI